METEFTLSLGTQRWPLPSTAEEITLGRAANADVRLPADDQISRIHARLVRTGGAWVLHDASRNGTGLNGRRLTAPTPLTNNDQVHIGRSVITFHAAVPGQPVDDTPASGAQPTPGTPLDAPDHGTPGMPPAATEAPPTPGTSPAGQPPADSSPAAATPPAASPSSPGQGEWQAAPSPDAGQLGPASTAPPPHAPSRPLTPRPAPPKSGPGAPPSRDASAPADSPFTPGDPAQADAGPRNDPYPADRASISQPNPADASNSASWPGYPSADYLESARSPLSGGDRAQIAQPDTPRTPYADRPDYPSYPDEPSTNRPAPRPTPRSVNRPERRTSETTNEVGQVRLARVLAIAGAMLAVGLVINLIATFLADGPGGLLRWLIAPTLALLGAMTFAILDAVSPTEREPSRLDVSAIVAIGAVLLGVGVGGFAITSGAEYAAGYLSGNESGEDRLIKPVGKTTAGLTITVDNVTNTSHFTRIRLTVTNKGADSVSLPLEGNATFTSAEGNSIRADGSRSNWPKQFAAGQSEQGTIVFKGQLPQGQKTAILTLRPGDPPVVLTGIPLSN